jgi:RNA polymerase-binding transcription factor DksA
MEESRIQKFKSLLEAERTRLIGELETVGRKNPDAAGDWEAVPPAMDALPADENEVADTIEEYEGNTAILKQLEIRLGEVDAALGRIEAGNYGICEVSGQEIEEDRLEANPAARTSKAHMNDELR